MKIDVQNTQTLVFRVRFSSIHILNVNVKLLKVLISTTRLLQNNLVRNNVGGLAVRADSRGSATSLRGWIHNNLFYENHDLPCLKVEGKKFFF